MAAAAPSLLLRLVRSFLEGRLTVLLMLVSLGAGILALRVTPREEEPQIVVPLADVLVSYPGGSAEEVEKLVSSRLERLLAQIDGVEYVYSMSRPGGAVVTVRFHVGEDREESLIKLYNKLFQNTDRVTPGIAGWVVKPVEIDDVPVFSAALHSTRYDEHELYRLAEEVVARLQHVPDTARITVHGGRPRVVQVYLDRERLQAYNLSPAELTAALQGANVRLHSGAFQQGNRESRVEAGPFLRDADEVRSLLVGVHGQRPVYLRDVARVEDGPDEVRGYSRIGFGPAAPASVAAAGGGTRPAVTVAVAKRKGSNAVRVARDAERVLEHLRGDLIPEEVQIQVTRDYGRTADEKVNNLVASLGLAMVTVIGLIAVAMSWRVGLIVAIAVPITYSLTLLINHLQGYTINRVTLFALILALGLLVDDPITAVENIYRHLGSRRGQPRLATVLGAMQEVLSPVVLSTLAIIASFLPMFFITGMMGPYMRPMALNVPLAVTISTLVSLTVTPWLAHRLLPRVVAGEVAAADLHGTRTFRIYRAVVAPVLASRLRIALLLAIMLLLFAASAGLALSGRVPLKMLPFDNRDEFLVLVDMPEGTTLEGTAAAAAAVEEYLATVPEVTAFTTLVGGANPMDFNGLVRHYYLREGPHVADIRVNLAHRSRRAMSSHELLLRIRPDIERLAGRTGAVLKLVEVPPGPPVLSTLVAEVYGQPHHRYDDLVAAARQVKARMQAEPGVVDLDDSIEENQGLFVFDVDREKAGLNGITTAQVADTLRVALDGVTVGTLHAPEQQNELPLWLRLPREERSDLESLRALPIKGQAGTVQLGELGRFRAATVDQTIHHKNQERVVYVTAEMAGRGPAYAVLSLLAHFRRHPLPAGIRLTWTGEGEWKITLDVFRDLGLAFAVALCGIYVLLVYETRSYLLPVVIMSSIPLTVIGIMPGFWLLNAAGTRPVGGFANPVFFTATAMIGMIALAGIVVRNGIILLDFIRQAVAAGRPLREAILEAGAVRFRPIFLTAGTTLLGAWPITLDPIFSGLAWALIFGLFVSTTFTLLVIPAAYYLLYARRPAPGTTVAETAAAQT